jgi:serine/threonine protein kinase
MCRGQRREETFENVLRNPLTFPSKPAISSEAQDLIGKLLIKDPLQRLGTQVWLSGLRERSHLLPFMPVGA